VSGFARRWAPLGLGCAVALAVGIACSGGGDTDAPAPTSPDAPPVLDESFRFCHDVEADDPASHRYCELLEHAPPDACPGLREACARGDTDAATGPPDSGCNEGQEGGATSSTPEAPTPPEPAYEPPSIGAADALVQVVRWTVALLVALALVGLLWFVGRSLLRLLRRDRAVAAPVDVAPAEVVVLPAPDALPEAPAADLLEAARRALDQGQAAEAVLFARGAALRALGDAGELRLHRSRTDREYVRAMRRDRERQGRLRLIVRAVEAVRWGGEPLGLDRAREAVQAALGLATALLVGMLLLSPRSAVAGEYDADGRAALVGVFAAWDYEASWRLRSIRSIDHDVDVLVLDADAVALEDADANVLREWVEGGGVLVLGGELQSLPELGSRSFEVGVTAVSVARDARDQGLAAPVWSGGPRWLWRDARGVPLVLAHPDGGQPGVVVQTLTLGQGGVLAIADPRVLDNGSLVVPENVSFVGGAPRVASYLGAFVLDPRPTLEVANFAGGSGADNPLASLSNARLLPLVAQLLLLLAVAALWRGWPFAPLRDPPSQGRLAFAEHARALGHRYFRVGATRHVAAAHADLWLRRLGPLALRAAAERHGLDSLQANQLVERLQALADDPDGPDEPVDIKIVEELWRITRTP
jgi:hypothetical protein